MTTDRRAQLALALDPARSVVVEACAGSGKTWMLVSRILRLLLAGVQPGEILAITYTRKAANQMTARLRAWLRVLALEDDETVCRFLVERGVPGKETEALLEPSRSLLERFLDAQPPITVNTFHGWFLELLRRAPLDSAVAASTTLLEKVSPLVEEAWQTFAEKADGDAQLADALDFLFNECGGSSTRSLLHAVLNRRAEWWSFTAGQVDPLEFALAKLREDLAVDPAADLRGSLVTDAVFMASARELACAFRQGSDANKRLAERLECQIALASRETIDGLVLELMTKKGEPHGVVRKSADRLGAGPLFSAVTGPLEQLLGKEADQRAWHFNAAALRCGVAFIDRYQALKDTRNGLDFTDVEWRTWTLLTHSDHAEYMQYKLDARYRHILLDEFQDVNPLQWQILEAWIRAAKDAGSGPQMFIVGDPKQSIYRFRRAEARLFKRVSDHLVREGRAAPITLDLSWRSSPRVMDAVNRVFEDVESFTPHVAQDSDLPGRIEVLPLAAGGESAVAARNGLRNPLDKPRQDEGAAAREKEAVVIAARIRDMVGCWALRNKHDEAHPERLARYADIMLLVRARTHLEVYERALRDAGIPYFSSRKGGLLQSLEIADITALLRFLITPFTDLDLALALRSPVFSCTDDDLMALAGAGEGSWWERLRRLARAETTSPALIRAQQLIDSWLVRADGLPVHDLLDRIYFEADVLARYRCSVPERMADTVEGNLVAFLELALAVDAGRYPSLPRFLDELVQMRDGDPQDAPDEGELSEDGDAVRILTVHAAKGLEAPVVFLIDAHGGERRDGAYGVLLDWPPDAARPRHFSVYGTRADRGPARSGLFNLEEARSTQEESNALYVAMTRAMQVLIVSGSKSKKDAGAASWHSRIRVALGIGEEGGAFGDDLGSKTILEDDRLPFVMEASAQEDDEPMRRPLDVGRREERFSSPQTRRGERIHRLLQFMAPPAPASDPAWLRELLDGDDAEFEDAWQAAKGILEADSLRRFFEPSRYQWAANEWPIMAEGEARRLDRVVEFEDEIWVLDYKTGEAVVSHSHPPAGDLYRAQLDLYVRAVSRLMPGKTVRSALIFAGGLLHVVH